MYHDVFIAGTGGQGVLLIGNIIAEAALAEGKEVTFLPSYGVEMRGGNANCTVVVADRAIGSPSITAPQVFIAMSGKALTLYQAKVAPRGLLIFNRSLIPAEAVDRRDVVVLAPRLNEIAAELGNARLANMIVLGLYLGKTGVVKMESLAEGMEHAMSERSKKYIPQNMEAIRKGMEIAQGKGGT